MTDEELPGAAPAIGAAADPDRLLDVWPYHRAEPRAAGTPPRKATRGPHDQPWGICLSGGGIRAASMAIGALQAMDRRGMVTGEQHATYLSAVSGGSYTTGAYTILARQLQPRPTDPGDALHQDPPMRDVPPYARLDTAGVPDAARARLPATPEERYLVDHSLYLEHGPGGVPGALWHLAMGILVNLALLVLTIDALARPAGWLAGRLYPAALGQGDAVHGISILPWEWVVLAVLGGGAVLAGLLSVLRPSGEETWWLVRASLGLLAAALAWLAVIGFPFVLVAVRWLLSPAVATHKVGQTTARLGVAAGAGGGLSLVVGLSQIRRLWARRPAVKDVPAKGIGAFLVRHKGVVLNLLASIAGPLLIGGTFVGLAASAANAAATGGTRWGTDIEWWIFLVVVLAGLWLIGDLNAWSPHSYYYERLGSVFAIGRKRADRPDPRLKGSADPSSLVTWQGEAVGALPWILENPELQIARAQPERFPEVLICACANVSDYGSIPTGFNATSFVFSSRMIGGPLVGAVPTDEYEAALGGLVINLPEAVSLAGAAVSPEMGKMTRAPLRFLLTMANVRLGAWIINPRHTKEQRAGKRSPAFPRPTYLFREMFGLNHLDAAYLYVTDGGHYENLGLVEQLRRGCQWIFCLDAAGDQVTGFHTLGDALAIARSELGVEIDIDPETDMAPLGVATPGRHQPWVTQAWTTGSIHYPGQAEPGTLVYIKAGVPPDAPWDVRDYAEAHTGFPTDPTLDQLYDAGRVAAYRALGEYITEQALEGVWKDFAAWRSQI